MLMNNKIFTGLILLACSGIGQANAQQRLVAQSQWDFNGGYVLKDSARYEHSSGTRANEGKYNIVEYDNLYDKGWVYDASGQLDKTHTQTFDGNNLLTERIVLEADGSNDSRITIDYDSGLKPDTVKYYTWSSFGGGRWSLGSRIAYDFNGNNVSQKTRERYQFGGGGSWRNDYQENWVYSGGNITTYTRKEWSSGNWVNVVEHRTKYASGKISEVEHYNWDGTGGSWNLNDKDIYTYDGSGRLESIANEFYVGSAPFNGRKLQYIYNGTNADADSIIRLEWDGVGNVYTNSKRTALDYNGAGQVTLASTESWDGSKWYTEVGLDSSLHYYYGWAVNVTEVNTADNGISVYPIPATNNINIKIAGVAADKEFRMSIIDIAGKVQRAWNVQAASLITVPVNELAGGSYILSVDDGNTVKNERFLISK